MTKETLSSKRKELKRVLGKSRPDLIKEVDFILMLVKDQDREFIKKLKEEIIVIDGWSTALRLIDNLAGEELINDNSPLMNPELDSVSRIDGDKPLKADHVGMGMAKPLKKGCGKFYVHKKYGNINCGITIFDEKQLCQACSGDIELDLQLKAADSFPEFLEGDENEN